MHIYHVTMYGFLLIYSFRQKWKPFFHCEGSLHSLCSNFLALDVGDLMGSCISTDAFAVFDFEKRAEKDGGKISSH